MNNLLLTEVEENRVLILAILLILGIILFLGSKIIKTNNILNYGIFKGNTSGFEKINQVLHSEIFSLNTTLILNSSSQIIGANARLQKMFGWEEKELINKGISKIILPEYIEQFENYKRTQDNNEDYLLKCEGITKAGDRMWVEIFIGKWFEGVTTCYTVILKNISHRVKNEQAQAALREQVDTLRKLYHEGEKIGNVSFWHLDLLSGIIEWCSPNFYHIFCIPRNGIEIKIEDIIKRVCEEDRIKVSETMRTAKMNNAGYEMEYKMNAWDGYVNTIHSVASAYKDGTGEVTYYIGMAQLIKKEKPLWG
jgi:PAS domain S-box-containing protein